MDIAALVLMIIGALNWGLIGLFRFDLVAALFGTATAVSRVVYTLVGIAGVWGITMLFKNGDEQRAHDPEGPPEPEM